MKVLVGRLFFPNANMYLFYKVGSRNESELLVFLFFI
jgi:hypothetical protein